MTQLTAAQVKGYARAAGFTDAELPIVAAIAYGESGWRTDAVGDTALTTPVWGASIGLMQVRSLRHPPSSGPDSVRDAARLTDPAVNMAAARTLYLAAGSRWTPWSTWNNRARNGWASWWAKGNDGAPADVSALPLDGAAPTTNGPTVSVPGVENASLSAVSGLASLGRIGTYLLDPAWWARVGTFALGYFLAIVGIIVIIASNRGVQSTASATLKTASKAAVLAV